MITRSVTIEGSDHLFLTWHDHINASALYRQALREEMALRDVDSAELRTLLERGREQGYSLEEIAENTERLADLRTLVESQGNQPMNPNSADG
jgi:hypothetical protein